jgi:hypothetical protein
MAVWLIGVLFADLVLRRLIPETIVQLGETTFAGAVDALL